MAIAAPPSQHPALALWEHARRHAANKGYDLFEGADGLLRDVIQTATEGTSRIREQDPEALIVASMPKVERLVNEMIKQAEIIRASDPKYPPHMLGEMTFRNAMCVLCPLPPFCFEKPDYCNK